MNKMKNLPKGWEMKKLGEVCEFQRGLTYSKKDEVEFSNNIVLRSNNIDLKTNKLDFTELRYIDDAIDIPENKKVTKSSLIICTANGSKSHLGKIALIDDDYNYAFGGFMGLLKPTNRLNSIFLYYLMISENYKKFIEALSDGANINNLKFSDLEKFQVPIPPLSEQLRIVFILDKAFEKIDKLKANTEKNLKNAKEIFENYLNEIFEKRGEGWEEKRLGEIATVSSGNSAPQKKEFFKNGTYPFIRTSDVGKIKKGVIQSCVDYLNDDGIKGLRLFKKGTILFPKSGASTFLNHRVMMIIDSYVSSHLATIKADNSVLADKYILYYLTIIDAKNLMQDIAYPSLKISDISMIEIPIPPLSEQQSIVSKLDALSAKTKKLEKIYQKKLESLEELKKAILEKAFRGEM